MLFHATPQDNFLTRLHPLIKITILGTTAICAFFTADIYVLSGCLVLIITAIRHFRIEFGKALLLVKLFLVGLPMLIGIFILSYLWKEPTPYQGFLVGITEGTRYALRFLILILVNFAIVLSTDPREIISTLRALRLPDTLSQILAHVINLLPRLIEELQAVVEAQTARGMRWKNLWRPSQWLPVALPVILSAMRYSEQTAISLELRGGLEPVVGRHIEPVTRTDWFVGAVCIIVIAVSIGNYYFSIL